MIRFSARRFSDIFLSFLFSFFGFFIWHSKAIVMSLPQTLPLIKRFHEGYVFSFRYQVICSNVDFDLGNWESVVPCKCLSLLSRFPVHCLLIYLRLRSENCFGIFRLSEIPTHEVCLVHFLFNEDTLCERLTGKVSSVLGEMIYKVIAFLYFDILWNRKDASESFVMNEIGFLASGIFHYESLFNVNKFLMCKCCRDFCCKVIRKSKYISNVTRFKKI